MVNHIYIFNMNIDTTILLEEYNKVADHAANYSDSRKDAFFNNWKIIRHTFPYASYIIEKLGFSEYDVRPRYYILNKKTTLKMHRDNGTLCSVNFILSNDPAPVNIEGVNYHYKQALLNTQANHGITESSQYDRILFKLSIMDCDFKSAKDIISSNLPKLA